MKKILLLSTLVVLLRTVPAQAQENIESPDVSDLSINQIRRLKKTIQRDSISDQKLDEYYARRQQERTSRFQKRERLFPTYKRSKIARQLDVLKYSKKRRAIDEKLDDEVREPVNAYYYGRRSSRLKSRERSEDRLSGGGRFSTFKNQIRKQFLNQKEEE